MLYIIRTLGENKRTGSLLDDKYVRLRGNFDKGRVGTFQRQTKYKLQALMEMGIVADDRQYPSDDSYTLELTAEGKALYEGLAPLLATVEMEVATHDNATSTWRTSNASEWYTKLIWQFIKDKVELRLQVRSLFLRIPAVSQMLNYLYRVGRKEVLTKAQIYSEFFNTPFVKTYCDQNGIEPATEEGAKHRCPFLLNLLESIGIISQDNNNVTILKFIISKETIKLYPKESDGETLDRIKRLNTFFTTKDLSQIRSEEESMLKENFGKTFLTENFFLHDFEVVLDEGVWNAK